MKLYDTGIIILLIIAALAVGGSVAHKWSKKEHHTKNEQFVGHDDALEETMEEIHGALTGQKSVDFTPESPE